MAFAQYNYKTTEKNKKVVLQVGSCFSQMVLHMYPLATVMLKKGLQSGDNEVTNISLLSKLFHMSLTVHCLLQSRYSSV